MSQFIVELYDPKMKIYAFEIEAKDYVEAVTKAMDTAFEQYPDEQFALAGYKEEGEL